MGSQTIESGVQLFSRLASSNIHSLKGINPNLFGNEGPLSNQVIEVVGESSNDLLLDFIIRSILPKDLNENWRGSGVIFVNSEHHISLLHITKVADSYLKSLNIKNRRGIMETALKNIIMLNCYDKQQLEMTLRSLEKIVQSKENVNLVIIDNLTAQYWQESVKRKSGVKLTFDSCANKNFQLIGDVIKNQNIVLIFSRHQVGDLKKSLNIHVDFKIITESNQLVVINYAKEITKIVPFVKHGSIISFKSN